MGRRKKRARYEEASYYSLSPETKKGIIVIFLFTIALLSILSFLNLAGTAGVYLDFGFGIIFGWGRFLIPLVLIILGYTLARSSKYEVTWSNYVGLILFILSIHGLFHLKVPFTNSFDFSQSDISKAPVKIDNNKIFDAVEYILYKSLPNYSLELAEIKRDQLKTLTYAVANCIFIGDPEEIVEHINNILSQFPQNVLNEIGLNDDLLSKLLFHSLSNCHTLSDGGKKSAYIYLRCERSEHQSLKSESGKFKEYAVKQAENYADLGKVDSFYDNRSLEILNVLLGEYPKDNTLN